MPHLSEKRFLFILRISVVIITLLSLFLANLKSNIYELVGESSALSLVSLFVPLVAGLWWKRANAAGAMLSMCLGILVWLGFEFFHIGFMPSIIAGLLASILGMFMGVLYWKK